MRRNSQQGMEGSIKIEWDREEEMFIKLATVAMQGMLAARTSYTYREVASEACTMAEAMITELQFWGLDVEDS